jgi:hypothetical protein
VLGISSALGIKSLVGGSFIPVMNHGASIDPNFIAILIMIIHINDSN